jgi:type III pantothenate kinase
MLIACDIGNSFIKAGLFQSDGLSELKSFQNINSVIEYTLSQNIKTIALSSVVPAGTDALLKQAYQSKIEVFVITHESKFNLIIDYKSPQKLGIDRICGAEGAFSLFKNSPAYKNYNEKTSLLTIDLGTATVINLIRYPGSFSGGIIAPGIDLMFDSLNKKTAQLPESSFNDYSKLFGEDTKSSIASGIINSTTGLIERTLNYLQDKLHSKDIIVYVTGGNAEKVTDNFNFNFEYVKGLVLIGIKAVYEINFPSAR